MLMAGHGEDRLPVQVRGLCYRFLTRTKPGAHSLCDTALSPGCVSEQAVGLVGE